LEEWRGNLGSGCVGRVEKGAGRLVDEKEEQLGVKRRVRRNVAGEEFLPTTTTSQWTVPTSP